MKHDYYFFKNQHVTNDNCYKSLNINVQISQQKMFLQELAFPINNLKVITFLPMHVTYKTPSKHSKLVGVATCTTKLPKKLK
jgi:hypothetical protein